MRQQVWALGWVSQITGKFCYANPDDEYYAIVSFFATGYWDGIRWVRIR